MTNALRLILMLAVLLVAGNVFAKSQKEFDRHVAEGQRAYAEKNYGQAIEEFEAAYQLDAEPVLLISIGRCHYLADRPREALNYYNRALQEKLSRSEREEVTASVAKATIKLQEQERKEAEEQRAADQAKIAALALPAPAPQKPPEKRPVYKTGWFWGTMAGIVATGVIVGVVAARPWDRPTSQAPPMPNPGDNIFPP